MKSVDPSIKIDVQYLTEDPNDGKAGFENPTGGKDAATGMYEDGADVVYHAAGKSGLGVFDAVEAAGDGNWAIGVDSDQYLTVDEAQKPHILTSMLKRIDTGGLRLRQGVRRRQGRRPGFVTYDLKADGVGYSTSGGFVDDIADQIDAAGREDQERRDRGSDRPGQGQVDLTGPHGRPSPQARDRCPGDALTCRPGICRPARQEGP